MKPHTSGPWRVVETDIDGLEFYILPGGDAPAIASGLMERGRSIEESRANARLLTAAPRLLATLERIAAGEEMTGIFAHAETVAHYQKLAREAIAAMAAISAD